MYPFFGRICEKCKNVEAPEHLHTEQLTNEMLCCFVESCSRFYHAVCVGIRYKFAYKCAFNNAWRCAECLEESEQRYRQFKLAYLSRQEK